VASNAGRLFMAMTNVLEADADIVSGEIFNVGDERMNHRIYQLAEFVLDVIPTGRS
jgi:hypothetical protein